MPKILLVEDDQVIAESIIFALKNDAFHTHWCSLATDALTYLNSNPVDLVLLDVGLPDISGFDVLRKIRSYSSVPVIIITARDDDADIVLALEGLGADDYITKPLSPRVLIARMRLQLKRNSSLTPVNTKLASMPSVFQINQHLNQVLLCEKIIDLTNAEYKILVHLINHPNRIHSKEYLLDIMWGGAHGSGESTITTHIKSIRKAIGQITSEHEYIKNHRGLGYSLVL